MEVRVMLILTWSPLSFNNSELVPTVFCDEVKWWHWAYLDNMVQLSPITLIDKANSYMDILKQVGDWNDTSNDTQITVLQACLIASENNNVTLFKKLARFISQVQQVQSSINKCLHLLMKTSSHQPPDWVFNKPSDPSSTKQHQDKTWYWCPKCNKEAGKWVCSHKPDEHWDSDVNPKHYHGHHNPHKMSHCNSPKNSTHQHNHHHWKPKNPTSNMTPKPKTPQANCQSQTSSVSSIKLTAITL